MLFNIIIVMSGWNVFLIMFFSFINYFYGLNLIFMFEFYEFSRFWEVFLYIWMINVLKYVMSYGLIFFYVEILIFYYKFINFYIFNS